jgi:inner membrane protein
VNPITHLLAAWVVADRTQSSDRDIALVSWAGEAPDLDGLGAVVDVANRAFGRETFFYGQYHHALLHGLPGALAIALLFSLGARRRLYVFTWCLATVHLHLLCDFLGSRGPDPLDVWSIPTLSPLSDGLTFAWSGQWALNAWPNILLTLALLSDVFVRAATAGRSPVRLFGSTAGNAFVTAVQARWKNALVSRAARTDRAAR